MTVALYCRERIWVNTDTQRRCYDGVNFSERLEWQAWELIGPYPDRETAESSAAVFRTCTREGGRQCEYEVRPA